MQEDVEEDLQKRVDSVEDQHLNLKLEVEEKKFQYKIDRRPVSWYGIVSCVVLVIALLGSIIVDAISIVV